MSERDTLPAHVLAAIARGQQREARAASPAPAAAPPLAPAAALRRRNKFGVAPPEERTVDGILFDSKAEATRYRELVLLKLAGEVRFFLRQVPFHLPAGLVYRADFQVHWRDGRVGHEDVKGMRLRPYLMKKALVENFYPVTIEELDR